MVNQHSRLIAGRAEILLFETLLTQEREQHFLKARGKQRTDGCACAGSHCDARSARMCGGDDTPCPQILATVAPNWLEEWVPSVWFERYADRFEEYRLPTKRKDRYALAEQIGADGRQLLHRIDAETALAWLREVPCTGNLGHPFKK